MQVIPYLADSSRATEDAHTFVGRLDRSSTGRKVHLTVKYSTGFEATFVHSYLRLASTAPGAFNRLHVDRIVSVLERDAPDDPQVLSLDVEWHPAHESSLIHTSEQNPYWFIPWDESKKTKLNHNFNIDIIHT